MLHEGSVSGRRQLGPFVTQNLEKVIRMCIWAVKNHAERCQNLTLHYGASQILYGIDLVARPGAVTAVMGTNGDEAKQVNA